MTPEQAEQEKKWAMELYESRRLFVDKVEAVTRQRLKPDVRRAVYQRWRQEYGDIAASGWARYAEAVLAGEVSLDPIRKMVAKPPNLEKFDEIIRQGGKSPG